MWRHAVVLGVLTLLSACRSPIASDAVLGPPGARITIVEVGDFACPFTRRAQATLAELRRRHGDELKVVWKDYAHSPGSRIPALAGCAAARQGRFADFAAAIWRDLWTESGPGDLSERAMLSLASRLGLDEPRFRADLESAMCAEHVDGEARELEAHGVHATPYFFVNGRPLVGARSVEEFEAAIAASTSTAR